MIELMKKEGLLSDALVLLDMHPEYTREGFVMWRELMIITTQWRDPE